SSMPLSATSTLIPVLLSLPLHAPPPRSTLFPYTTLFRSGVGEGDQRVLAAEFQQHRLERIGGRLHHRAAGRDAADERSHGDIRIDRKSTRLNSSHGSISYAVFCLKKKKSRCDNMSTIRTY